MAKNFVAPGHSVTVAAPYQVTSGQGAQVGAGIFGVAQADAANGATVVLVLEGIWTLPKEAPLVINLGDRLFWDNTNKRLTKTATSNLAVGVATVAAVSAATTVTVRLAPSTPAGT